MSTRFDAQADRLQWIVAYPDGIDGEWETYGGFHRQGVDDVAFVADRVDRLEATDRADPDRVYVTGTSLGGMMAYRLACELSSRLAAIAPVAGNMADSHGDVGGVACHPDRPVSILAINGSADTEVPIAGGGRFAPLTAVIGRWRELDGCARPTAPWHLNLATVTMSRCTAGSGVESIVLQGAGHVWPGTPVSGVPWGPAASLDASPLIADFFAAHRRAPAAR